MNNIYTRTKNFEQEIKVANNYAIIASKRARDNVEELANKNNFSTMSEMFRFCYFHPLMPQIFFIIDPKDWLWREKQQRILFLKSRTELKLQQLISFQRKNDDINKNQAKNERHNTN